MAEGWKLLRSGLDIEREKRIDEEGTLYLGCRQKRSEVMLPNGGMATTMEYDMEDYLRCICTDYYKMTSEILSRPHQAKKVSTPFLEEDTRESPARFPSSRTDSDELLKQHYDPTTLEDLRKDQARQVHKGSRWGSQGAIKMGP